MAVGDKIHRSLDFGLHSRDSLLAEEESMSEMGIFHQPGRHDALRLSVRGSDSKLDGYMFLLVISDPPNMRALARVMEQSRQLAKMLQTDPSMVDVRSSVKPKQKN